jgi:putative metallohydrolase (TIGR04338 family)
VADAAPRGRPRDTDRAAVYEAESLVRRLLDRSASFPTIDVAGSRIALPVERRFGSVESVQAYVDAALQRPAVRDRWPDRSMQRCTVRRRRGSTQAHYEFAGAVIAVPTAMTERHGTAWAMRESVVLHELAHHLLGEAEPFHGKAFREGMQDLVEVMMGPELRLLLLVSYADAGATSR